MPPAARITDNHTCPMVNPGPVPHVVGPIITGAGSVIIGNQPAARVTDKAQCVPAIDTIQSGASNVIIEHQQAARLGDPTVHGGVIVTGCPTVIIGTTGQSVTLSATAATGTPFCEECEKAKKAREQSGQA